MNVRFLNRHNTCIMEGVCRDTGARLHRGDAPYPCFAAAFRFVDASITKTFDITYQLIIKKRCDGSRNNFALLNKVKMCRLLNSFKYVIPFTYHFEEYGELRDHWRIVLHLIGGGLQHKGLLMLSRMLFEYPHNMCGMDALHLRELGIVEGIDFSKIPLINLYLLCISSTHFSADECFIRQHNPKFLKMNTLRDKLKRKGRKTISLVVPYKDYHATVADYPGTMECLISEEDFNRRLRIYIENYNKNIHA